MKDYMKPAIQETPDHVILHIASNNLNTDKETELKSHSRVDLVRTLKKTYIIRNNRYNKKGIAINNYLKSLCVEKNMF